MSDLPTAANVVVIGSGFGGSVTALRLMRLMRAMESRARNSGWNCVVSDTTDNSASANNFIHAGYRLYQPQHPWAWPNTLYWRKSVM